MPVCPVSLQLDCGEQGFYGALLAAGLLIRWRTVNDTLVSVHVLFLSPSRTNEIHTFLPLPAIPWLEALRRNREIDSYFSLIWIHKRERKVCSHWIRPLCQNLNKC